MIKATGGTSKSLGPRSVRPTEFAKDSYILETVVWANHVLCFSHTSDIYLRTKRLFAAQHIHFVEWHTIHNAPSADHLLTKIFCCMLSSHVCMVQMPVLLRDTDIRQLQQLSLYEAFPQRHLWMQYFYHQSRRRYRICDTVSVSEWHSVLNIGPFNIRIVNNAGDGTVSRHKVESTALAKLDKNPMLPFTVQTLAKFRTCGKYPSFVVLSIDIQSNDQQYFYRHILDALNRNMQRYINNEPGCNYAAQYIKKHKKKTSAHVQEKDIDFETEMKSSAQWNIPSQLLRGGCKGKRTKSKPCFYFARGFCMNGHRCSYKHMRKEERDDLITRQIQFASTSRADLYGYNWTVSTSEHNPVEHGRGFNYDLYSEHPYQSRELCSQPASTEADFSEVKTQSKYVCEYDYSDDSSGEPLTAGMSNEPGAAGAMGKAVDSDEGGLTSTSAPRDYRCNVIPSPTSGQSSAVIVDVAPTRNERQYKVVEHDGSETWRDVSSSQLLFARDFASLTKDDKNEDTAVAIVDQLTSIQIVKMLKGIKLSRSPK